MSLPTDLTYLQLRQRITGNLNRDDLDTNPVSSSSIVHQFVLGRVRHYSNEYFPHASQTTDTTKSTTSGQPWVDLPEGWQSLEVVRIAYSGIWLDVTRKPYEEILIMDSLQAHTPGVPTYYAPRVNPSTGNMGVRLFPVPDNTWTVEFTMNIPPAAPTLDADVNFWTTDAQDLIINSVCEQLCRERINRPLKADQHRITRVDEELSLGSKSISIMGGIQARAWY